MIPLPTMELKACNTDKMRLNCDQRLTSTAEDMSLPLIYDYELHVCMTKVKIS